MGKEKLIELIERTNDIKRKFVVRNESFSTGYDFSTHQKVNMFSKIQAIYNNPEFMNWRDELVLELSSLKQDTFISELINLSNHFTGFDDVSRFSKIESKLNVLKQRIDEYEISISDSIIDDNRLSEDTLLSKITKALTKLQRNYNYNADNNENTMNDYIRDILDESFEVKDQTRQGESESGNDSGEIDIQLCDNGSPIVMIEALKLSSLNRQNLNSHINKVLTKYDPNGCPYVVIIIYSTCVKFDNFYGNLIEYLKKYQFPYKRVSEIDDIDTQYAELKHVQTILKRNDKNIRVHFFVAHIL